MGSNGLFALGERIWRCWAADSAAANRERNATSCCPRSRVACSAWLGYVSRQCHTPERSLSEGEVESACVESGKIASRVVWVASKTAGNELEH